MAFGVSPILIEALNLRVNSAVNQTITIVRAHPLSDEQVQITVTGNGASAIQLPNQGLIFLPKGMQQVSYRFTIQPKKLSGGVYETNMNIVSSNASAPSDHSTNGSRLLSGAKIHVRFSVVDQRTPFSPFSFFPFFIVCALLMLPLI